jgi:hypothetical protein
MSAVMIGYVATYLPLCRPCQVTFRYLPDLERDHQKLFFSIIYIWHHGLSLTMAAMGSPSFLCGVLRVIATNDVSSPISGDPREKHLAAPNKVTVRLQAG